MRVQRCFFLSIYFGPRDNILFLEIRSAAECGAAPGLTRVRDTRSPSPSRPASARRGAGLLFSWVFLTGSGPRLRRETICVFV